METGARAPWSGLRAAFRRALRGRGGGDHATILAGTAQNVVGLGVFVLSTFAANVLISRAFGGGPAGAEALGVVTLATQLAFIGAAATRFGMDMAAVRRIAIEVGQERHGRVLGIGLRALGVAAAVSVAAAALLFAFAGPLARAFTDEAGARAALQAAALALPFVAITFVALGGSRGMKIMRHTLYVQWIGQPLLWIVLMVALWQASKTVGSTVLAYAGSWVLAALVASALWARESRRFAPAGIEPGETLELVRFGAPRAPAALLSQALFWTDYFVASVFVARGKVTAAELGVYSASVRVGQVMVLFLTAVSYMFSPFVADLHAKGERERLDGLFKSLTRWTMAGTIPLLALLLVVPGPLLRVFGGETFAGGETQLRILLIGQTVNVAVGAVGFILIMVGRTGADLGVYVASFLLDLALAVMLVPMFGTEGAAIAQTTTIALSNALRVYLVWRFVGIQPFNRRYLALAGPAAVCFAAMLGTHLVLSGAPWQIDVLGTGLIGGVVYLPALLLLGLTPTEKATIRHLLGAGPGRMTADIRPLDEGDLGWLRALMDERWGGELQVVNGVGFHPAEQPGFIAVEGDRRVGVITYLIEGSSCVIGLLQSLDEGRGIGSELVETVVELARGRGIPRVRVVTTNDNLRAQRMYERIGFRVVEVRPGAVDVSRTIKPSIPAVGRDGVPITDEIEYGIELGSA
jgi:O-antigen/teichoic acid export membrane protein/GNAT superfamily N-acetyltransferase